MKILLYEHVCGGGYAEQPLPTGILPEGYGMLCCAAEGFKLAGHEVTVLLDARLSKLNPPIKADYTVPVSYSDEPPRLLSDAARINDAVYIVAPETRRTLQTMVKHVESTGRTLLNSTSDAIGKVSDKAALYSELQKHGIPTPKTRILNIDDPESIRQAVKAELGYPVVFKPIEGAGCSGITLLSGESQIDDALEKLKTESKTSRFIAEQYVVGESASVSLMANGKKAFALALNRQQVNLTGSSDESSYCGGVVPFEHTLKNEAFALAQRTVELFAGLRGYVGVDLLLSDGGVVVVDVNARLTTSCVGLRRVAKINLAQAIIDAVVDGKLPEECPTSGYACFEKTPIRMPPYEAYRRALALDGVVSPPFPLDDNNSSDALVMGYGESLAAARVQMSRANKSLLDIMC